MLESSSVIERVHLVLVGHLNPPSSRFWTLRLPLSSHRAPGQESLADMRSEEESWNQGQTDLSGCQGPTCSLARHPAKVPWAVIGSSAPSCPPGLVAQRSTRLLFAGSYVEHMRYTSRSCYQYGSAFVAPISMFADSPALH
jgi:hypothetical protein